MSRVIYKNESPSSLGGLYTLLDLSFVQSSPIIVVPHRSFTTKQYVEQYNSCANSRLYLRTWRTSTSYLDLPASSLKNLQALLVQRLEQEKFTHVYIITEQCFPDSVVYTVCGAQLTLKPATGHKLDYDKVIQQYQGVSIVSIDNEVFPVIKHYACYQSVYNRYTFSKYDFDWHIEPGDKCLLSKDGIKYEMEILDQVMPDMMFKDTGSNFYTYIKPLDLEAFYEYDKQQMDARLCDWLLEQAKADE